MRKLLLSFILLAVSINAITLDRDWTFLNPPKKILELNLTNPQTINLVIDYSKAVLDHGYKIQLHEFISTVGDAPS